MLNLLILLALNPIAAPRPQDAGIIQPCIWPKCSKSVELVQFQPCVWPKCTKPELQLAQIQPCIWPKCDNPTLGI